MQNQKNSIQIRFAIEKDAATILSFIKALAEYEKLTHEVVATVESLRRTLFTSTPAAEVLILEENSVAQGFALFFQSYSTFLAKPGIYLEDLFVLPEARGRGFGKKLFTELATLAVDRNCGRLEWSVLDWNKPAIDFYLSLQSKPRDEWTTYRLDGEALAQLAEESLPA